jgi:hypothetical protein
LCVTEYDWAVYTDTMNEPRLYVMTEHALPGIKPSVN